MSMTIDEALNSLNRMKAESPLAGNTCLVVCLCDSGLAYADVDGIELEASDDGAVARIDVSTAELPAKQTAMPTYQLTLKGFNIEDPGTDHLIKWVNAPSYNAFEAFVHRCKVFDLLDEMPQAIGYRTEDDGVDLVIDTDPNLDKYGHVVEGWRAALTAATPEELDALELPFDWHQGDDFAYVITTEPPLGLCNKEDRIQCQVLADIPVHPESLFNVDAAGDAARFVADALNAFVKTPEGLERWKEVLAAMNK